MGTKEEKGLSKEDVLEMGAAAIAVHGEIGSIASAVRLAEMLGRDFSESAVPIPIPLLVGIADVMNDMISYMVSLKLINVEEVNAYMKKRVAEHEAATKGSAEAKPEGWCESCQKVHPPGDAADLRGEAMRDIAAMLHRVMTGRGEEDEPPTGRTVH